MFISSLTVVMDVSGANAKATKITAVAPYVK